MCSNGLRYRLVCGIVSVAKQASLVRILVYSHGAEHRMERTDTWQREKMFFILLHYYFCVFTNTHIFT